MAVNQYLGEVLHRFDKVLEDPLEFIQQYKTENRVKVIGWLPADVPEELIHASGAIPFGIIGHSGGYSWADAHLQTWACSLVRGSLGLALQGKLAFLDGLIIPHICDTTRNLGGIWKHVRPLPWMENYLLPRQVDRPSARTYLTGELGRLKARLEQCTGREITARKLQESIALFNQNRVLLRRLWQWHVSHPGVIGNRVIYNIIKSAMVIPREEHNQLLMQLLETLDHMAGGEEVEEGCLRLVLSGKVWDPPEIMNILDKHGAVVMADDFTTGQRYLAGDAAETGDPMEALALRQINRIPFACFPTARYDRRSFLAELAGKNRAHGVLFLHLKYCEPENFDYPDMRAAVESAGFPSLRVETDVGNLSLGQLETRIEAFLEMLRGRGTE